MIELTPPIIPSNRAGWVYLIHAENTNRYKIGRTINVPQRHRVLHSQSPYPLKVIHCFHTLDAITDEAKLHEKFASGRVYGEWFEPTNEYVSIDYWKYDFNSWTNEHFTNIVADAYANFGVQNNCGMVRLSLFDLKSYTLEEQKYSLFWKIVTQGFKGLKRHYERARDPVPGGDTLCVDPTEYIFIFLSGALATLEGLENDEAVK